MFFADFKNLLIELRRIEIGDPIDLSWMGCELLIELRRIEMHGKDTELFPAEVF